MESVLESVLVKRQTFIMSDMEEVCDGFCDGIYI